MADGTPRGRGTPHSLAVIPENPEDLAPRRMEFGVDDSAGESGLGVVLERKEREVQEMRGQRVRALEEELKVGRFFAQYKRHFLITLVLKSRKSTATYRH